MAKGFLDNQVSAAPGEGADERRAGERVTGNPQAIKSQCSEQTMADYQARDGSGEVIKSRVTQLICTLVLLNSVVHLGRRGPVKKWRRWGKVSCLERAHECPPEGHSTH